MNAKQLNKQVNVKQAVQPQTVSQNVVNRPSIPQNVIAMQAEYRNMMARHANQDEEQYETFKHARMINYSKPDRLTDRVLLSGATSGAGKIDMLLKREGGATIEELRACRGGVESHLNSLRKKGFNIVFKSGKYMYKPEYNTLETIVDPTDPRYRS
jgi:hypothetical protein